MTTLHLDHSHEDEDQESQQVQIESVEFSLPRCKNWNGCDVTDQSSEGTVLFHSYLLIR